MNGCCRMDDGALVCICCSVAGKHASIVGCDNTTQFCNYIIFVIKELLLWHERSIAISFLQWIFVAVYGTRK